MLKFQTLGGLVHACFCSRRNLHALFSNLALELFFVFVGIIIVISGKFLDRSRHFSKVTFKEAKRDQPGCEVKKGNVKWETRFYEKPSYHVFLPFC